jgi:gas vesicle protein
MNILTKLFYDCFTPENVEDAYYGELENDPANDEIYGSTETKFNNEYISLAENVKSKKNKIKNMVKEWKQKNKNKNLRTDAPFCKKLLELRRMIKIHEVDLKKMDHVKISIENTNLTVERGKRALDIGKYVKDTRLKQQNNKVSIEDLEMINDEMAQMIDENEEIASVLDDHATTMISDISDGDEEFLKELEDEDLDNIDIPNDVIGTFVEYVKNEEIKEIKEIKEFDPTEQFNEVSLFL